MSERELANSLRELPQAQGYPSGQLLICAGVAERAASLIEYLLDNQTCAHCPDSLVAGHDIGGEVVCARCLLEEITTTITTPGATSSTLSGDADAAGEDGDE